MKYDIKLNPADVRQFNRKIRQLKAVDQTGIMQDLRTSANTAVNIAKRTAPVDTGKLKSMIGFKPSEDKNDIIVFSDADYSGYVEFGTVRQNAQPYFMPAVRLGALQLMRLINERVKKAIKS